MDFFETVARRHCYRGPLDPAPIPRDVLGRILAAGCAAPSGKNAQTTTFVVVDDPAVLARIRPLHAQPAWQTAPAMIACITDTAPPPVYHGFSFAVEDCAAAVQTMLLALTALGYASVWVDGAVLLEGRAEALAKILGLPADKTVRIMLPVGRPLEPAAPPPKKAVSERGWFNRYGEEPVEA
jgi:nitroreductase